MRRQLESLFLFTYRQQNSVLVRLFVLSIVFIVVCFYFFWVWRYAVNIPFLDDFSLLFFSNHFLEAKDIKEKLHLFFGFHNEHRIAIPRLFFYFMFKLSSQVNFKTGLIVGNLFLFGLLIVVYKLVLERQPKQFVLITSAFFLFQFQHWENASWAMASLSNFCGIFFAGFAFYFLNRSDWMGVICSFMFAVFAICSNGGGLLVFFTVGFLYILTKKFRFLGFWCFISIVAIYFYFSGYVKPENHPGIFEALQHPARLFLYFISFLGGSLSADNHHFAPLAPIGGIIALLFFGYATWKKYYLKNPGVYGFLFYILCIAATASVTRSGFGLHQAFSSRYKIFSTVYLILSFVAVIELLPEEKKELKVKVLGYFFIFALALNIASFPRNIYLFKVHTQKTVFNMRNWVMKREGVNIKAANIDDRVMAESIINGIYEFPCSEVPLRKQDRSKWRS